MASLENKDITTLSGVALGGIAGGILASPLGPWAAVGGSTVGATVGGWVSSKIWDEFYTDLREKMERVKSLLENERYAEAVELISQLRAHPKYEAQEKHFRSELEDALGRITLHLAQKAEHERDYPHALEYYRRARQMRPTDSLILERIVQLKSETADATYEESGQLEVDLEDLLSLAPDNVSAYTGLRDLHDRRGKTAEAEKILRRAIAALHDRVKDCIPFLEDLHRRRPADGEVTSDLLAAYLDLDDIGAAAALVDSEIEAGEALADDPHWQAAKGDVLFRKGDLEGAETALSKALEEKGVLPRANLALGKVFILQKQWQRAISVLSPLVSHQSYVRQVLVPLTESLIRAGKLQEAELHLERSIFQELPEYVSTLRQLAKAHDDRNNQEEARRLWNMLGDAKAGPPFWQRYAIVYRQSNPVLLGAGRMGRIYLGRRREDDAMVAIREIPLAGMRDTLRMKRFRREVDILSELSHPNVANLYGHALLEGKCLMAVEYCRQGSLRDKMATTLLWSDIKAVALGILAGLVYLHEHEPPLVHRNLKPTNILIGDRDVPKIADFALSRLLDSPNTSVITSVQEQAAGYRYLSPEVILGSAGLGPEADLYSFGCILYELLTGKPPFDFPKVDDQIRAHLKTRPAPPSTRADWIPRALDDLALRLLAKVPGKRFSSASEVAEAVRAI